VDNKNMPEIATTEFFAEDEEGQIILSPEGQGLVDSSSSRLIALLIAQIKAEALPEGAAQIAALCRVLIHKSPINSMETLLRMTGRVYPLKYLVAQSIARNEQLLRGCQPQSVPQDALDLIDSTMRVSTREKYLLARAAIESQEWYQTADGRKMLAMLLSSGLLGFSAIGVYVLGVTNVIPLEISVPLAIVLGVSTPFSLVFMVCKNNNLARGVRMMRQGELGTIDEKIAVLNGWTLEKTAKVETPPSVVIPIDDQELTVLVAQPSVKARQAPDAYSPQFFSSPPSEEALQPEGERRRNSFLRINASGED
jgi:hypothetical protein